MTETADMTKSGTMRSCSSDIIISQQCVSEYFLNGTSAQHRLFSAIYLSKYIKTVWIKTALLRLSLV